MDFKGQGRNYLSQSHSYLLPERFFCSSNKKSLCFDLTPRTHGWCSRGDNPGQGCCLALPYLVQRKRPSLLLQGATRLTLSKHSQSLGVGATCRAEFLPVKQEQWFSDRVWTLSSCYLSSPAGQAVYAGSASPWKARSKETIKTLWAQISALMKFSFPIWAICLLSPSISYQIFQSHLFWQSVQWHNIAEAVCSSK